MTHLTLKAIIAGALAISLNLHAEQAEIDKIEQAASQLNVAELQSISQQVMGYDLALAQYRLGLSANLTQQTEIAKNAINASIDTLEQLDTETDNNVEVKALLAQVYGYKIALEPFKGVYYGPKSASKIEEAEKLAPNNPRVLLIKGIGALNTPAMFGGSMEVAYNAFDQAINAFSNDQDSNYHWGHAEAYTWRGLTHQQQGNIEKAKADWQHALTVSPNYGWAQSLLAQNAK